MYVIMEYSITWRMQFLTASAMFMLVVYRLVSGSMQTINGMELCMDCDV